MAKRQNTGLNSIASNLGWKGAAAAHKWTVYALSKFFGGLNSLQASFPWSWKLSLLAAILGATALNLSVVGWDFYISFSELDTAQIALLNKSGVPETFGVLEILAFCVGLILIAATFLAFWRSRLSLLFLKTGGAGFTVVWIWALVFIIQIPSKILDGCVKNEFDKYLRNELWIEWTWMWFPVFGLSLLFILMLTLRIVNAVYKDGNVPQKKFVGDRVAQNLSTHGKDPKYRSSIYYSSFLHIVFLFLPLILRGFLLEGYQVPKGDGNVQPQVVKIKKIKKKKPKDKYVFNPNSAISYFIPKLDDRISEEIDEETMVQYEATSLAGKKSKKSGKAGWPNGMENAKVRFIRLKYRGGDWDQDMGKGADYNFLLKFKKLTGFKIAEATESIEMRDLDRFPEKQAPPFVYLTGKRGSIAASSREVRILRKYMLEKGGMLFADNGGGNFNSGFRGLIKRVLPEKDWIDIANDDIIFQQPFLFPNGAPALAAHSGTRALGMKHNGRWVIFYHQGDVNDSWKDGAHVSEAARAMAFKIGINIVNYAFNQYMSIHYGEL